MALDVTDFYYEFHSQIAWFDNLEYEKTLLIHCSELPAPKK